MSGSLFARWADCGKEGCACQSGQRHGPYWVLSTRSGGRGGFAYLKPDQADEARRLIAASRSFRDGMRRLRDLGDELLRLLDKYKDSLARDASRRLSRSA